MISTSRPARSHTKNIDSDDSDDDSSLKAKWRPVKLTPVSPPKATSMPITKKEDSDDDSSVENKVKQAVKPIVSKQMPQRDDSENSDDSSTDAKTNPAKPMARTAIFTESNRIEMIAPTKCQDSVLDNSSDDESKVNTKTPMQKEVLITSACASLNLRRKVMDSDSEDSEHLNYSKTSSATKTYPTSATTTTRTKLRDSDDDESSSGSSSSSSLPLRKIKVLPSGTKMREATKPSDDDSSSSSSRSAKRSLNRQQPPQPIEVIDVTNIPDSKTKVPNYTNQIKTGQFNSLVPVSSSPIASDMYD